MELGHSYKVLEMQDRIRLERESDKAVNQRSVPLCHHNLVLTLKTLGILNLYKVFLMVCQGKNRKYLI